MKTVFEKVFQLSKHKTTAKTEVMAGITTFMTMAYILAVNPSVLSAAGMDATAVLLATALSSFIGTACMALMANLPFALSAGMGLNAFLAYTVVLGMGYTWQVALLAVFVEGLIFVVLSLTNVREAIFNAIPLTLKRGVSVGIGLFICFIGLQNAGLAVDSATLVTITSFTENFSTHGICALLALIGLPLSVVLWFTAQELVLIIFGDQWTPSIPVFRILTLSVGVQIILSSSGSIFQAAGDTKNLFMCGLFSSILNVTGILLGIFWFGTLEAVATCITLTFTVNFAQCYWMMYRMTLHRSLRHFAIQLISPLMVSILLIAVLYPLSLMTEGGNIFLTLIVKSIIFFCIFGCYIQLTGEYDITGKAKSIINKNKR